MRQATLTAMILEKRFEEALELLEGQIRAAELVDPRRDDSWGIDADILAYALLRHRGVEAFRSYWEELLRLFSQELEPAWGHLHKGHIFLRLGIACLAGDRTRAAAFLGQGLADDRLVAEGRKASDPQLDVEETVRDSPAYITLVIAALLGHWPFASVALREEFFRRLAEVKFDVIWGPQEVDPRHSRRALLRILPAASGQLLEARHELDRVFDARLPLATLSTLESFLVSLLSRTLEEAGGRTGEPQPRLGGRQILPELVAEAEQQRLFPQPLVPTVLRLAAILTRLLPESDRLPLEVELTSRVRLQIVVMLKILVDLALIAWSEAR